MLGSFRRVYAGRNGRGESIEKAVVGDPPRAQARYLIEREFPVFVINPKQLDRFASSGTKDDRPDARVLADSLRTDPRACHELEPLNARTVAAARSLGAVDYVRAIGELHSFTRRVVAWWEDYDLLLLPTITDLTPRLGEMHSDLSSEELAALRRRLGWLTPPWNITGQPAISLPLATSASGLPIGVQLVAAPDREDLLIEVARTLEKMADWSERQPPVYA